MPEMRAVPIDQGTEADTDTATQSSTGGGSKKETRYELGFFVRRVEETSTTPPAYPNPKPEPT